MKFTYVEEFGCTGYAEMSVFQGLSGGKILHAAVPGVGVAVGANVGVRVGVRVAVEVAGGAAVGVGVRIEVGVFVGLRFASAAEGNPS
jgi:hypothetical protein